ncbi:MAG: TraB/GumN family protein [Alphaproteobacteria bacterium]
MRRVGLLALAFASWLWSPSILADSGPALWKIDGSRGGAVYLFGTVHLVPKTTEWNTPALEAALKDAHVIVIEVNDNELLDLSLTLDEIDKFGRLPAGETISGMLPPSSLEQYRHIVAKLELPAKRVDALRPWIAAMLFQGWVRKANGKSDFVEPDHELWTWGFLNDKELQGIETLEQHFRAFGDLSREEEIKYFVSVLDHFGKPSSGYKDLVRAWQSADMVALESLASKGEDILPELHARLLKDRNEKWVPQIERMLADGRTYVIAVGTAHLVGKDSVVAMLRAKGIKVDGP